MKKNFCWEKWNASKETSMVELFFSKAAERRPEMLVKRALPGVILIITAILIITVVGKQSHYLERDQKKFQQWNIDFLEKYLSSKNLKEIREEELDITSEPLIIVIIYANTFISLLYSQS